MVYVDVRGFSKKFEKRLIFSLIFQNNWSSRSVLTFGKHSQTDPNFICLFFDSMEIFTTFLAVLLKMFWIKKKLKRRRKKRKRKKKRYMYDTIFELNFPVP